MLGRVFFLSFFYFPAEVNRSAGEILLQLFPKTLRLIIFFARTQI
jgi:hypothetical protein